MAVRVFIATFASRKLKPTQIMSNYFFDMVPREELERMPYLPTMGEFVEWMEKTYADMPALSDLAHTIT